MSRADASRSKDLSEQTVRGHAHAASGVTWAVAQMFSGREMSNGRNVCPGTVPGPF